jgi:hypothetical protein
MKEPAKNKVLSRIYGRGRGWVFSATDFAPDIRRWEADRSLTDLVNDNKIQRVIRGIYYYPEYSEILKKNIAPNIYSVAQAIARKYNWTIYPDGNTALNYLGLSTQVMAKNIYLSNGRAKTYQIGNTSLEFKRANLSEIDLKRENSVLIVQAIKVLGEIHITDDFIKKLSKKFPLTEWAKIKKDAARVTGWVYDVILQSVSIAEMEK